jgi:hypothetical protein
MFQNNKKECSPGVDFYGNNHEIRTRPLSVEHIGSLERINELARSLDKPKDLPFKLPEEPLW